MLPSPPLQGPEVILAIIKSQEFPIPTWATTPHFSATLDSLFPTSPWLDFWFVQIMRYLIPAYIDFHPSPHQEPLSPRCWNLDRVVLTGRAPRGLKSQKPVLARTFI